MCLSTVYLNEKKDELIAARYVAKVKVEGERIYLTDVIGAETEVIGRLDAIDLEGGTVIIRTDVA